MAYGVILADPPWQYRAWSGKPYGEACRTAESHYSAMSQKDLIVMRPQIDAWAKRDCSLFLWATPPALREALEVMEAWGFAYKTIAFVWIKTGKTATRLPLMIPASNEIVSLFFGLGHYTRGNAELVLLGTRGKATVSDRSVEQVVVAPRSRHSEKPEEVRRRIERLYPDRTRLELFARRRVPGWDAHGDEL